ncbi:MAG: selenide, water dikinase, partial [Pseudomonadota bacterium]
MYERDLLFIGGGHTHALVIRSLAMKPINGVRITLVSEQTLTPYSGMLPGFVAGHYTFEEAHIDLNRLCQWANVRYISGRV